MLLKVKRHGITFGPFTCDFGPFAAYFWRLSKRHAANTHRTGTCIQHFHSNIQTIVIQVVVRSFLKGTCFGFVLSTQTKSHFTVYKGCISSLSTLYLTSAWSLDTFTEYT
jgi:hypothetical protein